MSWEHVKAFRCCYHSSTQQKQYPTVNSEAAQVFAAFLEMAQGKAGTRFSSQTEQSKLFQIQTPPADQVPPELLLLLRT